MYWLVKSITYPFIINSPFLRDNDPQIPLPAANYILRRVQVQFRLLEPALGRIRVSKPRKSSVVACVFHLVSACDCFMPYTINRARVQLSCYVHGSYVWICGRTCRGSHNGWTVKWNPCEWKKWKRKNRPKTKKDNDRSSGSKLCALLRYKVNGKEKKTKKNSWKPSIKAIFSCTCAIFPQKQVRYPFGKSLRSCGVFLTWFEYVPVFQWKWSRHTVVPVIGYCPKYYYAWYIIYDNL